MSGSAFLHIQNRDADPIRVVELAWITVRIGRAAFCEIRLAGDDLASEVCRLQRRGRAWSLVPGLRVVPGQGQVLLQGQPLAEPIALPFDVPFQIGPYSLVLKSHRELGPSRDLPRPLEPTVAKPALVPQPFIAASPVLLPERPSRNLRPDWTPPQPVANPVPPNPWEARWRAAAAGLRPAPAPRVETHSVPAHQPPVPYRGAPLQARSQEPAPAAAEPPVWNAPEWVLAAEPRPSLPPRIAEAFSPLPAIASSPLPIRRAEEELPPPPAKADDLPDGVRPPQDEASAAPVAGEEMSGRVEDLPVTLGTVVVEPACEDLSAWLQYYAPAPAVFPAPEEHAEAPARHPTPVGVPEAQAVTGNRRTSPSAEPTPEARAATRPPRSSVRTATLLDAGAPAVASQRIPRDSIRGEGERLRRDPALDLPSAREILAAARRPAAPRGEASRQPAVWERATPTLAVEPSSWSLPLWLAWPPAALLVLLLGLGGSVLSILWADDASRASLVRQRLLALDGTPGVGKPLPEGVSPPSPSWWRTTPRHLAEWGVYLGRTPREDEAAEPGELIEAAVRLSPLDPTARLARAQQARGEDEQRREIMALGLSRDAVSLGWTARMLRRAGKKDAAIRAYREALEIACRVDHVAGYDPGFSADPAVRRYLLPGEPAALPIVRELVEDSEWAFADWSSALPPGTVAALAAARLLQERGRPEAHALLESLAEAPPAGSSSGDEAAVRLALRAEACALLSRWREAEQAYRQAIDEARDLTIQRSWWFNLANVAAQLDDERQRDAALQAALGTTASDDIGRRALELQRGSEPLARLRAGGTRAN